MSYKHALALTAFGIGAVLQGCGEDEKDEKDCTVGCQDKCKDIDGYAALTKAGTYEDACGLCIETRLGEVEGQTTPITKWTKVLADALETDATDDQKALPLQALQYCGAKQHEAACGTPVVPVDHVSTKAGIDAKVVAAGQNCGLCYLLVAVTDCATGLTSLTACGNAPNFVCEQDYSCHDIAGAYDDLDPTDAAVNTVCKTCLDAEVTTDTDITGNSYLTAWAAPAEAAALADHLLHCGAEQHASSCASYTPTDELFTDAATLLTGIQDGLCEVCVHMDDLDAPSCREMKTSLVTCGALSVDTNVRCPECALFVFDDDCKTCLKEQNGGADWVAPALVDYTANADYAPWLKFAQCGAVVATTACADRSAFTGLDLTGSSSSVDAFETAIAGITDVKCNACLNLAVLEAGTYALSTFQDAINACAPAS